MKDCATVSDFVSDTCKLAALELLTVYTTTEPISKWTGYWEPGSSLEEEAAANQGKGKARTNAVLVGWNQRY